MVNLTGRETLLVILGAGIALLLAMSVSAAYSGDYRTATGLFAVAAVLAYIFFRHRKVLFTITALSFLLVNVGLSNVFHRSVSGYLVTYGSAGGLFLLLWWRARKRSQLGRRAGPQDMHRLFDKDTGDAL
jgi:hypothetical protein